jgi:hypothetical protein
MSQTTVNFNPPLHKALPIATFYISPRAVFAVNQLLMWLALWRLLDF